MKNLYLRNLDFKIITTMNSNKLNKKYSKPSSKVCAPRENLLLPRNNFSPSGENLSLPRNNFPPEGENLSLPRNNLSPLGESPFLPSFYFSPRISTFIQY